MIGAVERGGLVLDLQVIRPNPTVEADALICEIDAERLLRRADAAHAVVDARIDAGLLALHAVDDHDLRKHYISGLELIEDFEGSDNRRIPLASLPRIRAIEGPCLVRERCRVRCLVVR